MPNRVRQLKRNVTTIKQKKARTKRLGQKTRLTRIKLVKRVEELLTGNEKERTGAAKKIIIAIRTKSKDRGRLEKAFTTPLINALKNDSSWRVRVFASAALGELGGRTAINALKHSVFDYSRDVRKQVVLQLAKHIGYVNVAKLINKTYPRDFFKRVPSEFMADGNRLNRAVQTQETRQWSHADRFKYARESLGKPDFWHRGLPVYLVRGLKDSHRQPSFGRHEDGVILLNMNKRFLNPEFRRVVAEHEFGEMFSHEIGLVMELLYAEKNGLLDAYVKHPNIWQEIEELVITHKKDFDHFTGYLKGRGLLSKY